MAIDESETQVDEMTVQTQVDGMMSILVDVMQMTVRETVSQVMTTGPTVAVRLRCPAVCVMVQMHLPTTVTGLTRLMQPAQPVVTCLSVNVTVRQTWSVA